MTDLLVSLSIWLPVQWYVVVRWVFCIPIKCWSLLVIVLRQLKLNSWSEHYSQSVLIALFNMQFSASVLDWTGLWSLDYNQDGRQRRRLVTNDKSLVYFKTKRHQTRDQLNDESNDVNNAPFSKLGHCTALNVDGGQLIGSSPVHNRTEVQQLTLICSKLDIRWSFGSVPTTTLS